MVMRYTSTKPRMAVLICCHNRREKTTSCIELLEKAFIQAELGFSLYTFDDGSTDGTSAAISSACPQARITRGDGSYFWTRSMHVIFKEATRNNYSHYLWLNDDTLVYPHAISTLLSTEIPATGSDSSIVVGAIQDPSSGSVTYGGGKRRSPQLRPFYYKLLEPSGTAQEIDVMNGNVVLIPRSVAEKVGNLDPVFEHGMGDTDYALRARKLGIKILLTPEYVGVCSRNPMTGTFHDKSASLVTRVKYAFSRKGLPMRSWFAICARHGGIFWPLHFVWGYIGIVLAARK